MIYYFFLIGTLFFSVHMHPLLCTSGYAYPDNLKPAEKLVIKIQEEAVEKIMKKYNLKQIGEGASMPRCVVHSIHLHFLMDRPLNKDQVRELLINCAHDFLEVINSYHELAEYAPVFPFKIDNIDISIGSSFIDPNGVCAMIKDGVLTYHVCTQCCEIISEESEPYEIALEMIRQNKE